jgi:uncharacterized protein YjbJ (UPF0337 family)
MFGLHHNRKRNAHNTGEFHRSHIVGSYRRTVGGNRTSRFGNIGNAGRSPAFSIIPAKRRTDVDREHVKGAADKVKGAIKDTAGKLTGDKKLQTEGKIDKAKGAAHKVAGDVRDAVRHARDD